MFRYINSFLGTRQFSVVNSGYKSKLCNADLWVPQGSPLSSTIFIISFQYVMDTLRKNSSFKIVYSAYADDLVGESEEGNRVGLQFSQEKTKFLHICRKRKCVHPEFMLYAKKIINEGYVKLLGITFQNNYKFDHHIRNLRIKLIKDFNVLKALSIVKSMQFIKILLENITNVKSINSILNNQKRL